MRNSQGGASRLPFCPHGLHTQLHLNSAHLKSAPPNSTHPNSAQLSSSQVNIRVSVRADAVMRTTLASRLISVIRAILPVQVKLPSQAKLQASPLHGLHSEVLTCLLWLCNSIFLYFVQQQPCYADSNSHRYAASLSLHVNKHSCTAEANTRLT